MKSNRQSKKCTVKSRKGSKTIDPKSRYGMLLNRFGKKVGISISLTIPVVLFLCVVFCLYNQPCAKGKTQSDSYVLLFLDQKPSLSSRIKMRNTVPGIGVQSDLDGSYEFQNLGFKTDYNIMSISHIDGNICEIKRKQFATQMTGNQYISFISTKGNLYRCIDVGTILFKTDSCKHDPSDPIIIKAVDLMN
jgi:hypothetical protein